MSWVQFVSEAMFSLGDSSTNEMCFKQKQSGSKNPQFFLNHTVTQNIKA